METVKGQKRRDIIDLLDEEELKYQRVVEQGNVFNIQCDNDEEVSIPHEMDGLKISNQLVEEHLKIKEEGFFRGKKTEGHLRVHSTEIETEGKPKVEINIRNGYIQERVTRALGRMGKGTHQPVQWPPSRQTSLYQPLAPETANVGFVR